RSNPGAPAVVPRRVRRDPPQWPSSALQPDLRRGAEERVWVVKQEIRRSREPLLISLDLLISCSAPYLIFGPLEQVLSNFRSPFPLVVRRQGPLAADERG